MTEKDKIYKVAKIYFLIIITFFLYLNSRLVMYKLPIGEFLKSVESPNKEYTLNAYRYAGKTIFDDWSVRVEVQNNKTKKKSNIYYKYHQFDADIKWLDNKTVQINGMKLNAFKNFYHNNA